MPNPISRRAAAARDAARDPRGKFGIQPLDSTSMELMPSRPTPRWCDKNAPHAEHAEGSDRYCTGVSREAADRGAYSDLDRSENWVPATLEDIDANLPLIQRYTSPIGVITESPLFLRVSAERDGEWRVATKQEHAAFVAHYSTFYDLTEEGLSEDEAFSHAEVAGMAVLEAGSSQPCHQRWVHYPHRPGDAAPCPGVTRAQADAEAYSDMDRSENWVPATAQDIAENCCLIQRYASPKAVLMQYPALEGIDQDVEEWRLATPREQWADHASHEALKGMSNLLPQEERERLAHLVRLAVLETDHPLPTRSSN